MKKKVCGGNRTVGYFTGFGSVAQLAVVVFLIVEQTLFNASNPHLPHKHPLAQHQHIFILLFYKQ